MTTTAPRRAHRRRQTKETTVDVEVTLDGTGRVEVATGIPFFDHMVAQLGKHGGWDLTVTASGDLAVDTHHTIEDVGILLGEAVAEALGDKAGVRRFASIDVPLDETLVEVAVDLSGRPYLHYDVDPAPGGESFLLGQPGFDPQLAEEFWRAFAHSASLTLHLRLRYGRNTHHILEASFKGVARALRDAVRVDGTGVPSTKGMLAGAPVPGPSGGGAPAGGLSEGRASSGRSLAGDGASPDGGRTAGGPGAAT